jgi:lipopolysaccharide transport system ATP-binding protein
MSSDAAAAIHTEDLGKRYLIRHEAARRTTLVETLGEFWRAPLRRQSTQEVFWALRNVSLSIAEGDIVGLVGRNGAGKSTFLKILSRITVPTEGRAVIRGRVGSLLEVGTGFHPELTGRENIFLNGSFLGMRRQEIRRKFDAIVSFAEVDRFLDTPIKRYSSGMYVRLAFSVAAHLEPEILLVDEVLAVGDAAFQAKCLGKMGEVARSGRTVVFVSHNLPTILALTKRCIWIEQGTVAADGPSQEVVGAYLQTVASRRGQPLSSRTDREGSGEIRFTTFGLRNDRGEPISRAISGDAVVIALGYEAQNAAPSRVEVALMIHGEHEQRLFILTTSLSEPFVTVPGSGTISCRIAKLPLQPGAYPFTIFCKTAAGVADWIQHAAELDVAEGDFFGSGRLPPASNGPFLVLHDWSVEAET